MFKFFTSDLPVLLNVDIGTYQIILSVYLLLLFVGITAAYCVEFFLEAPAESRVFHKLVETPVLFIVRPPCLRFARGP
jgi:hypothetical protein